MSVDSALITYARRFAAYADDPVLGVVRVAPGKVEAGDRYRAVRVRIGSDAKVDADVLVPVAAIEEGLEGAVKVDGDGSVTAGSGRIDAVGNSDRWFDFDGISSHVTSRGGPMPVAELRTVARRSEVISVKVGSDGTVKAAPIRPVDVGDLPDGTVAVSGEDLAEALKSVRGDLLAGVADNGVVLDYEVSGVPVTAVFARITGV